MLLNCWNNLLLLLFIPDRTANRYCWFDSGWLAQLHFCTRRTVKHFIYISRIKRHHIGMQSLFTRFDRFSIALFDVASNNCFIIDRRSSPTHSFEAMRPSSIIQTFINAEKSELLSDVRLISPQTYCFIYLWECSSQ